MFCWVVLSEIFGEAAFGAVLNDDEVTGIIDDVAIIKFGDV